MQGVRLQNKHKLQGSFTSLQNIWEVIPFYSVCLLKTDWMSVVWVTSASYYHFMPKLLVRVQTEMILHVQESHSNPWRAQMFDLLDSICIFHSNISIIRVQPSSRSAAAEPEPKPSSSSPTCTRQDLLNSSKDPFHWQHVLPLYWGLGCSAP